MRKKVVQDGVQLGLVKLLEARRIMKAHREGGGPTRVENLVDEAILDIVAAVYPLEWAEVSSGGQADSGEPVGTGGC